MRIIVGIDPGLSGGVAITYEDASGSTISSAVPMPITQDRYVDCRAISGVICSISDWVPSDVHVFIERVWALPKQGGMEKFIKNAGMLLGMCDVLGFNWVEVLPKAWKYALLPNTGEHGKEEAIRYAREHYPHISLLATPRSKKEHDGMADAICIMDYGRLHGLDDAS